MYDKSGKNNVPTKTNNNWIQLSSLIETILLAFQRTTINYIGFVQTVFAQNTVFCLHYFHSSFQFLPEKFLFCFICPTNFHSLSSFHTIIKIDIKQRTFENTLKAVTQTNLELLLCFHLNEKLSCFYISQ